MKENEFFKEQLTAYGFEPSDAQLSSFDRYYEMLIEWNEKINLTAITEYKEVFVKHFLDSVSIIKAYDMSKVSSIIDVGTGAGFPGIPIKIMFPDIHVTLLDSLNKRLNFLNEVISELTLKDIYTVHGRAEDIAKETKHREMYDLCVSRAVANLSTLSELCIPFVKINGSFVSYKSEKATDEIKDADHAIKIMGGSFQKRIDFDLDGNNRTFIIIDKISYTPKKYPRKAGTPAKEPLR
ncbi:MAG: 16S rRNA (guanine(527)-N(7))-methyltransferase RsmG [Lachnospiraceae bacterium]|nr:16S rRNA (guanine(527)-N(7))-methyltransferase RsmG [Lachnospiraceae bacterium]